MLDTARALIFTCLVALPHAGAQTAPAPRPARKALFWKASSPTNVIYLLGSIHLGSKDLYPLPKEIEEAFAGSAVLLVEADVRHVDMAKTQAMVLAKGMYAGEDSLWNHVSAGTREKVERFCAQFGIPPEGLVKLKPWVVALTAAAVPMMKAGLDPNLGIDMYFLGKADEKRIVEIESAQWQIDLVSGFSPSLQEQFLSAAVEDAADEEGNLKRLQDAWFTGDAQKLDALIRESSKMPEEINKALLKDRNPHMADAAVQFLKGKEQAFLVVGAAHLVGPDGVVSLLQKRGYKVEQVSLKP